VKAISPRFLSTGDRDAGALERLFDALFFETENTRLLGGAAEPEYRPADEECPYHRLLYREDYFSSALHEIAHWCIAGPGRRRLADFGYWYRPDGRDPAQQRAFERVEVRPQALEWIFTEAAGCRFVASADNLDGGAGPSREFLAELAAQRRKYLTQGLPPRAARWRAALARRYGGRVRT
jgi:hypothetical protein